MAENNGLSFAPVLIINLCPIFGPDRRHGNSLFLESVAIFSAYSCQPLLSSAYIPWLSRLVSRFRFALKAQGTSLLVIKIVHKQKMNPLGKLLFFGSRPLFFFIQKKGAFYK